MTDPGVSATATAALTGEMAAFAHAAGGALNAAAARAHGSE